MPNWCDNSLTVTGDEAEIARFLTNVRHTEEDGSHTYRILTSLVPCPQELMDTESGWSADEEAQAERQNKYTTNLIKYGAKDWYDWCNRHWGTKWSDCDTDMNYDDTTSLGFSFNTAWSPPSEAFVKIGKLYPTLTFVLSFQEQGACYAGATVVKGNNYVTNVIEPEHPDNEDSEDFASDSFYEKMDEAYISAQEQALQLCLDEMAEYDLDNTNA